LSTLQIKTPAWAFPLLKPARYKGVWGGRGSGKSHFFAELMIEEHIIDQNSSSVCVREIQKTLSQSVKRTLELKIESLNAGSYFNVQDSVIKSVRGNGVIIFQGMQNHTAASIKSLEGFKRAWIEEAQSISQRSLDLLRPTMFRQDGSEIWAGWNPNFPTDPIDELLRGEFPPTDSCVVRANYADNPWFPDGSRAEMEYDKKRNYDKYTHIWLGEYICNSESRVFKNWTIDEFITPVDAVHRFGADFGFSIDPTVLVRCHVIGRKLYIDYEVYMVGCEIVNTPDLFMSIPDSEKWPIVADSSRPETISHLRKNGFPKTMAATKGARSVEEGIEWLQSYEIIVHPRCQHTIDELRLYSYKIDPLTDKVIPILDDKDNHVIDSLRYACEGVRRAAAGNHKVGIIPIPRVNKW
jgi:phage terminase large subunit